jgi:hypothetical protein
MTMMSQCDHIDELTARLRDLEQAAGDLQVTRKTLTALASGCTRPVGGSCCSDRCGRREL